VEVVVDMVVSSKQAEVSPVTVKESKEVRMIGGTHFVI
jgi:hypothetical protein